MRSFATYLAALCLGVSAANPQSILTADGLATFGTNAPAGGGGGGFPSGAVIDWRFNNSLADSSGNANTATMTSGSASYTTDEATAANKAIALSGSQAAQAGSATPGNFTSSDFTVSTWVKVTQADLNNNPVLFSKGIFDNSGYYGQFIVNPGSPDTVGRLEFALNPSGQNLIAKTGDTVLSVGTWYNIVCVRSGTAGLIYINGVDSTSHSDTMADPVTDSHNFQVGTYSGGGDVLTGNIAQITVWGRALTPTEIASVYSGGSL